MKSERPQFFILHSSFFILLSSLLSGCFTVSESAYPAYPMTQLADSATGSSVALRGFEATFFDTIPIHGYQQVYVPGCYGCHYYYPGHYETVCSTGYIQQSRTSTQFAEQATDRMEAAGFNVKADPADYAVEVHFTGPCSGPNDPGGWRGLFWLCTLCTSDRSATAWRAKLKIYDNRSGKLLFTRDYEEEYGVTCFSPLPVFGPMCFERTERNYMQAWCLTALTDRATAEASAFIAGRAAAK